MFSKPVTVQYPEQHPVIPERYRGRIILTSDPSGDPEPISPSPLTASAWPRPGPVTEADEGPFAAAGEPGQAVNAWIALAARLIAGRQIDDHIANVRVAASVSF